MITVRDGINFMYIPMKSGPSRLASRETIKVRLLILIVVLQSAS
jgi:hypothetical protein